MPTRRNFLILMFAGAAAVASPAMAQSVAKPRRITAEDDKRAAAARANAQKPRRINAEDDKRAEAAHARKMAEEKARREAAEKAKRDAAEKARRDAAEKAKREAAMKAAAQNKATNSSIIGSRPKSLADPFAQIRGQKPKTVR